MTPTGRRKFIFPERGAGAAPSANYHNKPTKKIPFKYSFGFHYKRIRVNPPPLFFLLNASYYRWHPKLLKPQLRLKSTSRDVIMAQSKTDSTELPPLTKEEEKVYGAVRTEVLFLCFTIVVLLNRSCSWEIAWKSSIIILNINASVEFILNSRVLFSILSFSQ